MVAILLFVLLTSLRILNSIISQSQLPRLPSIITSPTFLFCNKTSRAFLLVNLSLICMINVITTLQDSPKLLVPSPIALPAIIRMYKIPSEAPGALYSLTETWVTAFSLWSFPCIKVSDGSGQLLQLVLETVICSMLQQSLNKFYAVSGSFVSCCAACCCDNYCISNSFIYKEE